MTQGPTEQAIEQILDRIDRARDERSRILVGIAGAPASGKSTLADELVKVIVARDGAGTAALVPMDGYHLDNAELDARGLRHIKGAPQTFDALRFLALVREIKQDAGPVSYPCFDRVSDRTIPDAGHLAAGTPVVVIEGNYLLLNKPVWANLGALFDVTVMLSVPLSELRTRLVNRWLTHGLSRADAEARADGNDIANSRQVIKNSASAHLTLGSDHDVEILER